MNVLELINAGRPDKVVFSDSDESITYAEFIRTGRIIGTNLAKRFGVTRQPVAVFVNRSVRSLCAMFGIVSAETSMCRSTRTSRWTGWRR